MNSYNNNNTNNNNNDNDQQHNETLFWKVFHNKYIRHCIIDQIEKIEIDGKRKKFKEITSLLSLITNKQHQLLKCKLEASEHIQLCKKSLSSLFESILVIKRFKDIDNKEYYRRENSYIYTRGDEYIDNEQRNKVNALNSRQSYNLLLKYKSKQLLEFNLLSLVIAVCLNHFYVFNETIVEIIEELLLGEQYNDGINNSETKIDLDLIKLTIQYCHPAILDKLLNHLKKTNNFNNIITKEIKNNSISLVTYRYRDEMLEYILNNDQLFNKPSPLLSSPTTTPAKRFKSSISNEIPISNSNDGCEVMKLKQNVLSHIKSQTIQFKLLQSNYFETGKMNFKGDSTPCEEFDKQLSTLLSINDNYNEPIFKSISMLFSRQSSNHYSQYLSLYDEPIDGFNISLVLRHSLENKSINGLKYLLSLGYDKLGRINKANIESNDLQIKPEFIKLYTTGYKYFKSKICDKDILNFIYSIKSSQEYEMVINSIVKTNENKNFTDLIYWKWSDISIDINKIRGTKRFIIQDIETIDIIATHFDQFKLLHKHYNEGTTHLIFKFETWQLIDYAKSKYGSLFFNKHKHIGENDDDVIDGDYSPYYIYPFTKAINNCDLESLRYIDQLLGGGNVKFDKFEGDKSIDGIYSETILKKIKKLKEMKGFSNKIKIHFNHQIKNDNIIKLIEYLNSSGFTLFSGTLFVKFISDISRLDFSNNFKINFQKFQSESFKLILDSISDNVNPRAIKLVLNNINPLVTPDIDSNFRKWEDTNDELLDTSYFIYDYIYSSNKRYINYTQSTLFFWLSGVNRNNKQVCFSYESSVDIISCIGLVLGNFENHFKNQTSASTNNNNNLNEIIQKLVNYLFKRLIKVYCVDINRVKRIYQFIKSNWLSITGIEFIFQHSLYHISYYLSIRSLDFTKYINSEIINEEIIGLDNRAFDNLNYKFEDLDYFDKENSDTPQFQLFKSFSYDYIFNTRLLEIIAQLNTINSKIQEIDEAI